MGAGERRSGGPWVSGPAAPGRLAVGLRGLLGALVWGCGGVGVWQQAALVTQDNCSLVPLPPPAPPPQSCLSLFLLLWNGEQQMVTPPTSDGDVHPTPIPMGDSATCWSTLGFPRLFLG